MKRILLSLALALGIFSIPIPSFATVSSTTNTVQYSGDGYSTSFSFNNNVYLASDLNVYEVTAGVSTLLTLNTNYSVSLTAISGVTGAYTATINLAGGSSPAGALAVGTTLVIVRNIPYTQLINISDYSATPAATWNQAHDRGVILSQQLLNLVNRSILQAINATSPIVFPSAPGISNQLLGWDATGRYLINTTGVPGPTGPQGPAGSISSVTSANTDIGVANTTTTPVLTLNSGTSSNQIVKLNGSAQLPAVSGALLTNLMATSGSPAITVGTGLSFSGGTLSNTAFTTQNVVTGLRNNGVFHNTTGKTMFVTATLSASGPNQLVTVYSDSSLSPNTVIATVEIYSTGAQESVSFMVLAGNYYQVTGFGGSVIAWTEWY